MEASADSDVALEMRDIGMSFGSVSVLTGVDYSVKRGSIHGLVGHNGAGKSTLMKIALGGYAPTQGTLRIGGKLLEVAKPSEARRLGLGMVLQERSLIYTLNGLDNLFLNAEYTNKLRVVKKREERQEAIRLCERLGISHDVLRRRASEMTAVEQQMLEIAKAVRLARNVLILDEPTAPLSHREIDALFEVIRRAAALGAGIVLITHHLAEVFAVCDEITCLREGLVTMHSSTKSTDMAAVIEAMLGKSKSTIKPRPSTKLSTLAKQPVIALHELSVEGKFPTGISFDVAPGEIVGIAGLVGSGRSTLLRALFGEAKVSSGRMELNGQPYRPRSAHQAIKDRVYLIPESRAEYGLVTTQKILENIMLPVLQKVTSAHVVRKSKGRALARPLLAELDVRSRGTDQLVGELSGGNQQKIVLAKALAIDAELLLLDEPTFGVDIGAAAELIRNVRAMAERGKGVLWATSDLQELLGVADRVIVIADGGIRCVINRGDLEFTEADLIQLMQRSQHTTRQEVSE